MEGCSDRSIRARLAYRYPRLSCSIHSARTPQGCFQSPRTDRVSVTCTTPGSIGRSAAQSRDPGRAQPKFAISRLISASIEVGPK